MTDGVCALCGQVVAKGRMTVHLRKCTAGRYEPDYWLHLEMPATAQLYWLDSFLRGIWLECCGHMSGFMAGRRELDDSGDVGDEFAFVGEVDYTYDYGSSTDLKIRVAGEREGQPLVSPVALLARNLPPDIRCHCGEPAVNVCRDCRWEGTGWLCKPHSRRHACGSEMLAPVTNSPRVGECAYFGEDDGYELTPGQAPADVPGLSVDQDAQRQPARGRYDLFGPYDFIQVDEVDDGLAEDEADGEEAEAQIDTTAAVDAVMALVEPFCAKHLSPLWSAVVRLRLEEVAHTAGHLLSAAAPSLWATAALLGELGRMEQAHPGRSRAARVDAESMVRELGLDLNTCVNELDNLTHGLALASLTSWEYVRAEPHLEQVLELALPACRELGLERDVATLAAGLIRALSQHDPDAVCRARATSWAAAGILAAVQCNPEVDPDLAASPVAVGRACKVSEKTLLEKHAQLAHYVGPFGPDAPWRLLRFRDPAEVFTVQLGAERVDARAMPREWQEEALLLGLIPRLPEDWPPTP
ncbi:MAG: hypothetical protein HYU66_20910 [Armatimonadetes bacterium]|nr:hypothetical protein [Armatimonadota bacterium]